ncbi:MAG: NAD-dependent epimerase/dehydratase family protein [Dehalococcoidales bacterium]|nr:NAD-dependent epimerase/dehydratase family protein [Dehalococcoidales bacterium]
MRVVVTGASGFIGRHVVAALVETGAEVVALSRRRPVAGVAEWHAVDILGPEARKAAAGAEAIVHLAGLSDASFSREDPFRYSQVNAQGTVNMLEAARAAGAFFVLASSQRIYEPGPLALAEDAPKRPADPYGFSKLAAELWLRMYREVYGVQAVALRFFSVFGPGQGMAKGTSGVVSIFLRRAMAGEPLWVDGAKRGDFTNVSDVAGGILAALEHRHDCREAYNVATGIGTPLPDLARLVLAVTRSSSRIEERAETGPGRDLVADISLARKDLGYSPKVALAVGLARTYEWLSTVSEGAAESTPDGDPTG